MLDKERLFDIFADLINKSGGYINHLELVDNKQIDDLFHEYENELYQEYGDEYDTVFCELVGEAILNEFDLDGAIHEARSNAHEQHLLTTNPEKFYGFSAR